jgi:hypothetical protein
MASLPELSDGIALTHFIVAEDVERAGRFYRDVLGGEIVLAGEPTIVLLANSFLFGRRTYELFAGYWAQRSGLVLRRKIRAATRSQLS